MDDITVAKGGWIGMVECEVTDNCKTYIQGKCWICNDYSLYLPISPHILCKRQIRTRAERKAQKKVQKQSDASRIGRRSKAKGREGENEVVKLLERYGIVAERVPLSGALKSTKYSCDVVMGNGKRIEVKRRKSGLTTIKKWLSSSNYIMINNGKDIKDAIIIMPVMEFIELINGEVEGEKKLEIKDKVAGLKTINKWLDEDVNSNYVFYRGDGDKNSWIVIMRVEEFIKLGEPLLEIIE